MPITLNCPKCHKPFRVRDESIGGRVRCPSCGSVLQVPAALSPASHFGTGDEPKSVPPSSSDRPVAEDVPGRGPDVMLGGAGRREDAVDFGPPGGSSLPAPPSIKARVPVTAPPPRQAAPPPAPPSRAPRPERRRDPVMLGSVATDASAWSKVRGGLGMIRWGLFLFSLVFIGAIAHGAWFAVDEAEAMKAGPGFLGKEDWPRWKELMVAYTAVPITLGVLLLLAGRVRCGAAPSSSHASGLALGAAFFTVIALLAAAVYVGITYFDATNKLNLTLPEEIPPPTLAKSALYAGVPSIVLAEILTLLFVGQIGWPLGRPQLQRSVAGFFVYALLMPAAILIGHQYYPALEAMQQANDTVGSPFAGEGGEELAKRALIWAVILLAAGALLLLRYAGVAGAGRKAIRKYLAGSV